MEAALRTAYEIVTGTPFPFANLHVEPIAGLEGVKEASVTIEGDHAATGRSSKGATLKVAVAHGLGNAQKVIDQRQERRGQYHFVEVMTCPGGCIGGGGQPRFTDQRGAQGAHRAPSTARTRAGSCASRTRTRPCCALYEEFLGAPLRREVAPPAAHPLLRARPRLRRGTRRRPGADRPERPRRPAATGAIAEDRRMTEPDMSRQHSY